MTLTDDWMTVPEAARRLGLSRGRVAKLCKDGRISGAKKYGRQYLIPEGAKIEPPPSSFRAIEIPRKGKKGKP